MPSLDHNNPAYQPEIPKPRVKARAAAQPLHESNKLVEVNYGTGSPEYQRDPEDEKADHHFLGFAQLNTSRGVVLIARTCPLLREHEGAALGLLKGHMRLRTSSVSSP